MRPDAVILGAWRGLMALLPRTVLVWLDGRARLLADRKAEQRRRMLQARRAAGR